LCGEPPPAGGASDLRDLADLVAALHGDDAPSKALLGDLAHRLRVRALAVVQVDGGRATARAFLSETSAFDVATYGPDPGPTIRWTAATNAFARTYGADGAGATTAPPPGLAIALHEPSKAETAPHKSLAFYESGWFWGAVAGAALVGGAVFLASRDNSASTIHLEMQVPR
jgi:hypothetical protein